MKAVMLINYWKKGTPEHTDINKSNTKNEKKETLQTKEKNLKGLGSGRGAAARLVTMIL